MAKNTDQSLCDEVCEHKFTEVLVKASYHMYSAYLVQCNFLRTPYQRFVENLIQSFSSFTFWI